ncbi:MAG: methyltransferase domain-containing protein [Candidatus Lokiarchaeota archaeon]|nr:methyltransferase domain-containing protein [Candidatus Lokiarchaeota archaeon]MBD3201701.1 methyltransferase domain-containing protein [Candidatus Lokiarchaeota archaeon]
MYYPLFFSIDREIYEIKGPSYLCDEIKREEDKNYVAKELLELINYLPKRIFKNKVILDFGCGSGASTIILARALPESKIIALDTNKKLLEIANHRADFYNLKNIDFLLSTNKDDGTPSQLEKFDIVIFNAVIEHLTPQERVSILTNIWHKLHEKGLIIINETPNRLSPFETHTTNLPFINYLPNKLAYYIANKFSKNLSKNYSWEELLKNGIRGTTIKEIFKIINSNSKHHPKFVSFPTSNLNNSEEDFEMILDLMNQMYGAFSIRFLYGFLYAYLYPIFNKITKNLFQHSLKLIIMKTNLN